MRAARWSLRPLVLLLLLGASASRWALLLRPLLPVRHRTPHTAPAGLPRRLRAAPTPATHRQALAPIAAAKFYKERGREYKWILYGYDDSSFIM